MLHLMFQLPPNLWFGLWWSVPEAKAHAQAELEHFKNSSKAKQIAKQRKSLYSDRHTCCVIKPLP